MGLQAHVPELSVNALAVPIVPLMEGLGLHYTQCKSRQSYLIAVRWSAGHSNLGPALIFCSTSADRVLDLASCGERKIEATDFRTTLPWLRVEGGWGWAAFACDISVLCFT